MKILVVDDEKLLVKGIKFNLENEGYTVDTAYDGETAVSMMMGTVEKLRISWQASSPSFFGIIRSRMMRA